MITLTRSRTPLSDTIVEYRHRTGASLEALEAKARKQGHVISRSQLNKYERNTAPAPGERMVRALAAVLDLPVETVFGLMVEQYYDLDSDRIPGGRYDAVVPADLSETEKAAVRAFVEAMRRNEGRS